MQSTCCSYFEIALCCVALLQQVTGPVRSFTFKRKKKVPKVERPEKPPPEVGVNLRDVGSAAGSNMRAGMLFRSSQLLR